MCSSEKKLDAQENENCFHVIIIIIFSIFQSIFFLIICVKHARLNLDYK